MNTIKFQKSITDYSHILAFDIAKHKTGWALWNIETKTISACGVIATSSGSEWEDLYEQSSSVFDFVRREFGSRFFVIKERLPNQAGRFSTIAALQGLAGAHSVFDLACSHKGVDVYDADGIHSITVKAYFKSITGLDKPEKKDIANAVFDIARYDGVFKDEYDVTDAAACAITLLAKKWNSDIVDQIKHLKSEQKKYKLEKKRLEVQNEIDRISGLKIDQ